MRIASVGHALFATTLTALGILGLIKGNFTPVWDPVPKAVPGREMLVYLCALVALASGVGLLFQRTSAFAARVLLGWLLVWFLLLRVVFVVLSPTFGVFWPAFETSVFVAASWVLYTWLATDWDRRHLGFVAGSKGLGVARVLYGLALIFFGFAHFYDPQDTLVLMRSWLPWHVFWAYFFGCTFVAAGLGVIIGVFARLAAALAALQIGIFTMLVWVPMVAAGSRDASVWSETIVSAALTAGAWVMADSYRDKPWLAMNNR